MLGKVAAAAGALGFSGLLLLAMLATALANPNQEPTAGAGADVGTCAQEPCFAGWDPGNIISDAVFYNTEAMSVGQVRSFIDIQGAGCAGPNCLRNLTVDTPPVAADRYCRAYPGGAGQDAASVIVDLSAACGVNPQVMLVTLQNESHLLTRADSTPASYAAAWGWACPDTGPGGTANCDPGSAGFFQQALGMAKQWARYRLDPAKYRYHAGDTAEILWNIAESGCGGAQVTIQNQATAALYNYTPYQPNPAAIAAYPGEGDRCSAYGNRNFFYLFQLYFGDTGGGTRQTPAAAAGVAPDGVTVTVPNRLDVPTEVAGKIITAPNAQVAAGIAAGFETIGMPYVWGGGTDGGGPDQGCNRGGGALNSCAGTVGLDCSGLTAYILARAGFDIPTNSGGQRTNGTNISRTAGLPGDIVGYSGHVALYLGRIDGTEYLLEAPHPGSNIHIRAAYWTNHHTPADTYLHRYWH